MRQGSTIEIGGGLGDLFQATVTFAGQGIINRHTFFPYLFESDLDSFIKKIIYAKDYINLNKDKGLHGKEFVEYIKSKLNKTQIHSIKK